MEIGERWTTEVRSLRVEDFFAELGERPFAFLYGDGPGADWIILGEDPLFVLERPDLGGLRILRSGERPPFFPDFLGFVSYEYGYDLDPQLPEAPISEYPFPRFHFALHRKLQMYHKPSGVLYTAWREGPEPLKESFHSMASGRFYARKVGDSDTPEDYRSKVSVIREEIAKGNVYQANLTRQERWAFSGDLRSFAQRLYDANPAPFSAMIAAPEFAVVSSSPERFIRIAEGRILSSPIKGTAPRGQNPEEDEDLSRQLLASAKNRAELAMITDLIRNDLTRVCRVPSVQVESFPELQSYANVHHLVSHVGGTLQEGLNLETLLHALFPGGSITGCPKLASMQLIRRLEVEPRQVYTGALGWFAHDLSALDFNVAIRTAWTIGDSLLFGVGGGIVWDSEPQEEYLETVHKGRSLVECLN